MSLGPTFVKATDNLFYKNPIIEGKDFFICFDEDDDPELVIRNCLKESVLSIANQIFKDLNLSGKVLAHTFSKNKNSLRIFNEKFCPAFNVFLNINKPIPKEIISKHDGILKDTSEEGTYYTFDY